jgi:bacillithiol system protein YtxJ
MVVELRQAQDFDQLLQRSHQDPVVIFKHSTQCSRSADARDELNAFIAGNEEIPCGIVLVIENRKVSDEIEDRLGILHESPQALVVVNENPVWHASHWNVTAQAIHDAVVKGKREA